MLRHYAVRRAVAVVALLLAALAALGMRLYAAPTGAGYRAAMAASPSGGLFFADPGRGLMLISPAGGATRLGALPSGTPLALAADQSRLLLGTDSGLFSSEDRGLHWLPAPVPPGRYLAVALSGRGGLAGAWGGDLWRSGDLLSWARTLAGVEVEAFATQGDSVAAATLTGMLSSPDGGAAWQRVHGLPDRLTALDQDVAADWRGDVYERRGDGWRRFARLGAGVWALDASDGLAATTAGLYRDGERVRGTLGDHEVTALVDSGQALYAAQARGPVHASLDRGVSWRPVFQP